MPFHTKEMQGVKKYIPVAERFVKRSVSRLESTERALPVRGKGRVSRLFQKPMERVPLYRQPLKKGLKA